ncbi:MAG: thiamine pyrophosphate-binding protein [Caulobacterales bacterium]
MPSEDLRLTGGELLASTLVAAGVKRVFALHGGHLDAFFKGCVDLGVELIDFRHEAAAGHAADAYARTTGELGVCAITAGPGFTNAVTAMANAHLDGSPVLFIVGAAPLREIETNPLQGGIDQIAAARPLTKWALSIPATERIPDLAAMAIRKALTGRRGPVVLEVPIDVLHASVRAGQATQPTGLAGRPHPAPAPDEARRMVELLRAAKRPALIAGMEAVSQRASDALTRFSEAARVPVFAKTQAMGLLAPDHPLDGGAAGNLAALPMIGLERPDLVILLGARMGLLLGGRSGAVVPHDARVIQIHSDAGEIGRLRNVDLAIAADAAETLDAVLAASGAGGFPDYGDWPTRSARAKSLLVAAYPERETAAGVHPYHAAAAVAEAAGREAIWALDGGEAASWMGGCIRVSGPGRVLTHGYLGCLGVGLGFAIGAQIAHPERRVVHVTGDGAMGFHIQELDTMARRGLPIVTVVMNNQIWGMSIHGQQIMYGKNYNAITKLGMTRYGDIASAFGCHGERVSTFDEIAPAMRRALDSGRPSLLEIMTDPDVVHPVTVSMLGKVGEDKKEVLIPYYENVPASAG